MKSILHSDKIKYLGVFMLVFCFINLSAQKAPKEEKKLIKKARKALTNEKYISAQEKYTKLLSLNPMSDVYNFETGLSYYYADFERSKSIPFFESAIENSKEDTIPEIYYYLARAYQMDGRFEKSEEAFKKFQPNIKNNSRAGQLLVKNTDDLITLNKNAEDYLINKNENILIRNLGSAVNSKYNEYAPIYRNDDQVLLFTSRRPINDNKKVDVDLLPFEDVYIANKTGRNNWNLITDETEMEKYVPKKLNTREHDAGIIYSSDGKTLYTYKNDLIWKSIFENDQWSNLQQLDKNINTSEYNTPSISLSKDGKTIFFVTTRKEGFGKKDIYKSTRKNDGTWNTAENLGQNINTPFDEESPYLSDDGQTLFFASKGHKGIGGYDLYKSNLINNEWGEPENLGIPINSPVDDIYLIIDKDEMKGFLSSAREGGNGGMDLYNLCMMCPVNNLNGLLVNKDENPINDGSIIFKSINIDSIVGSATSKEGVFSFTTETTGKHKLIVDSQNYQKQDLDIELPNNTTRSDLKIKLNDFQLGGYNFQTMNLVSDKLKINLTDTIQLGKIPVDSSIIVDNSDINNELDNSSSNNNNSNTSDIISNNIIGSYQEFFDYNVKDLNILNPAFITMINKAIDKVNSGEKINIEIKSSASRVPTRTHKTNINLASLRGIDAKRKVIDLLIEKGVSKDKIITNKVKSIVSGPKYKRDYKNTGKYRKYQYVTITVK